MDFLLRRLFFRRWEGWQHITRAQYMLFTPVSHTAGALKTGLCTADVCVSDLIHTASHQMNPRPQGQTWPTWTPPTQGAHGLTQNHAGAPLSTHTHVHTHTYTHAHMGTCTHVHIHTGTRVCPANTWAHTPRHAVRTCTHMCTYRGTRVHTPACTCTGHVCSHRHTCTHMCTHAQAHMCTGTHAHTQPDVSCLPILMGSSSRARTPSGETLPPADRTAVATLL